MLLKDVLLKIVVPVVVLVGAVVAVIAFWEKIRTFFCLPKFKSDYESEYDYGYSCNSMDCESGEQNEDQAFEGEDLTEEHVE